MAILNRSVLVPCTLMTMIAVTLIGCNNADPLAKQPKKTADTAAATVGTTGETNQGPGSEQAVPREPGTEAPQGANNKRTVLVLDEGFDTQHPALKDRIKATYRITCGAVAMTPQQAITLSRIPTNLDEMKAYIAVSETIDDGCRLSSNASLQLNPAAVLRDPDTKTSWNTAVASKDIFATFTDAAVNEIGNALFDPRYRWHGSGVAGIIAHDNPNVDLVVVDQSFGGDVGGGGGGGECIPASFFSLYTEALNDQAFVNDLLGVGPADNFPDIQPSAVDLAINDLVSEHNITLSNESWGPIAREDLERVLQSDGCPALTETSPRVSKSLC